MGAEPNAENIRSIFGELGYPLVKVECALVTAPTDV